MVTLPTMTARLLGGIMSTWFPNRRLFLNSNSKMVQKGSLEHCIEAMVEFLGPIRNLVYLPFATVASPGRELEAWSGALRSPRLAFKQFGVNVHGPESMGEARRCVYVAEAIMIGGGNTYSLLHWLYRLDLISDLERHLACDKPIIGSSAGTNVLCPTIRTTNDWRIITPKNMNGVNAIPFQINPHYIDPDPLYGGESREERIREYHLLNSHPVLGLREDSWLLIDNGRAQLGGGKSARLFLKGQKPTEHPSGAD